jgi:hypothetical protein
VHLDDNAAMVLRQATYSEIRCVDCLKPLSERAAVRGYTRCTGCAAVKRHKDQMEANVREYAQKITGNINHNCGLGDDPTERVRTK